MGNIEVGVLLALLSQTFYPNHSGLHWRVYFYSVWIRISLLFRLHIYEGYWQVATNITLVALKIAIIYFILWPNLSFHVIMKCDIRTESHMSICTLSQALVPW